MRAARQRAVFTADPDLLEQVQAVVQSGRYRSSSAFLREAIREKLERLRRDDLARQVEEYCAAGHAGEDIGLVAEQAFDPEDEAE
jgi:Arc/MetJ-type ribon-helix-helix transcriptional regulator